MPHKDPEKRKEYNRRYSKQYYQEHREAHCKLVADRKRELLEWFWDLRRGMKCARCSEDDEACLDFHHLDAESKDNTITDMVFDGYSKKRVLEEIEKCEVLCSNCHRKLHYYS